MSGRDYGWNMEHNNSDNPLYGFNRDGFCTAEYRDVFTSMLWRDCFFFFLYRFGNHGEETQRKRLRVCDLLLWISPLSPPCFVVQSYCAILPNGVAFTGGCR